MAQLTVIVPIYNTEKYLHQCVDSILNQTMKDIDIILVDDGSTDSSGHICDKYSEQYSNVRVVHQKNMGLYGARLIGMKYCKTQYVTFVDADDFIEMDAYVHALDAMRNNIDIVLFDIYNYSEKMNIKKRSSTVFPYGVYDRRKIREIIFPKLIWNGSLSNALQPYLVTKIFKFDLLYKVLCLYNKTEQYYGEDNITTYAAVKMAESVEFVNHAYYNYRARDVGEIPPYISSDTFFDEAYCLYKYLKNLFVDEADVLRQLDMFYIEAINCRKKIYGMSVSSNIRYIFPFDRVEKSKNIVLYGAGEVGKSYREQLAMLEYSKNILWVDKNYEKYHRDDIVSVDNILEFPYDYIVVAVANKEVVASICKDLFSMGISEEKVVTPRVDF